MFAAVLDPFHDPDRVVAAQNAATRAFEFLDSRVCLHPSTVAIEFCGRRPTTLPRASVDYDINVIPALFAGRTSNVTVFSQPALEAVLSIKQSAKSADLD